MKKINDSQELMTREDEILLAQIEYIKKNIVTFIDKQKTIDKIIEIINNSDCFSFKSKRSLLSIDKNKPIFVITINKAKAEEIHKVKFDSLEQKEKKSDDDYFTINKLIQKEITSKFSDFMKDEVLDKEKFKEILKENKVLFYDDKKVEEAMGMISFLTSMIFSTNIELKNNIIYLEYMI